MSAKKRWTIYIGLFAATCLLMLVRIAMLDSDRNTGIPFHSANDRSRWLTIRSLGDFNTYEIDQAIDNKLGWNSIDKVRHVGVDGRQHFYSSKPTLLPTLMTYEYKLLKSFGVEVSQDPFIVAYVLLITFNVIPILVICVLVALLVERYVESDWARIYIVACVCLGTYLTTFAITLNNHVPGALGSAVAIYALIGIWIDDSRSYWLFFLAGLGAAWAGTNELPALSFLAVAIVATLIKSIPRTLVGTLAGVLLVIVPSVVTSVIAHGTWVPPYAHRKDGPVVMELDGALEEDLDAAIIDWSPKRPPVPIPTGLREAVDQRSELLGGTFSEFTELIPGQTPLKKGVAARWVVFDNVADRFFAITKTTTGKLELRLWDNWYEYPGSYWLNGIRSGVDLGNPSAVDYAVHCLVGHHGIFSLTPIWVFSLIGMGIAVTQPRDRFAQIVLAITVVSVVVIGFYFARPQIDRNYGGVSCTLRWLLWLAPLWIVCLIPAADRIFKSGPVRVIAVILLMASASSSLYAWLNPWQHPWLYWELVKWDVIQPF